MNGITNEVKYEERQPTLEELKQRMNLLNDGKSSTKSEFAVTDSSIYNDNLKNLEEIKKRKAELVQGQKNLLKGIYANTTTSCYQEVYKAIPQKYHISKNPDFKTSSVKGIIPDRLTQSRLNNAIEITDELKNKVKNIMFY